MGLRRGAQPHLPQNPGVATQGCEVPAAPCRRSQGVPRLCRRSLWLCPASLHHPSLCFGEGIKHQCCSPEAPRALCCFLRVKVPIPSSWHEPSHGSEPIYSLHSPSAGPRGSHLCEQYLSFLNPFHNLRHLRAPCTPGAALRHGEDDQQQPPAPTASSTAPWWLLEPLGAGTFKPCSQTQSCSEAWRGLGTRGGSTSAPGQPLTPLGCPQPHCGVPHTPHTGCRPPVPLPTPGGHQAPHAGHGAAPCPLPCTPSGSGSQRRGQRAVTPAPSGLSLAH